MKTTRLFLALALLAIATHSVFASSPSLSNIFPRGAKRGTEIELNFHGDRLDDAVEVMPYTPGFAIGAIEVISPKHIKAKVNIAPDAKLGEHLMRIRTSSGLSPIKSFWVGQFDSLAEKEPNNDFTGPQPVTMNTTVEGVLQNEDVDYYVTVASKGQRISAEVEGIRLAGAFYDPYVAILNSERFELAASDDTALLLQDSAVSVIAPADGNYIIQIRESSYTGNDNCRYRLHVGAFPRPMAVYPAGGQSGSAIEVRLIGDPAGETTRTVTLPPQTDARFHIRAEADGLFSPSPNILRVSPFPNVLETEPNNSMAQATVSPVPLPAALNGIISENGDQDWFRFSAKKGQRFIFRAHAKSIGSPLDTVLNIYGPDKKGISGNDDADNRQDSKIDFTAPVDGEFTIRVRDHLKKGGADYVYRIEAQPLSPGLGLTIPYFGRADYQSRQMVYVARGNRFATRINAGRTNFGGDLLLEAIGLPQGITLKADRMHTSVNSGIILFEATPEAPVAGSLVDLIAKHAEAERKISGSFSQPLDFVLGQPNNTVYYKSRTPKFAVAVVEQLPFEINVATPSVPLVRNGTLGLRVTVTRKEGFDAPITVRHLWNPPGISSQPTIKIPKGQNEIIYTLTANSGAALRTWQIAVMGESDAGKGQILASSALVPITIAEPYLGMKIEMAAVEQGKAGAVICKLTQSTPFEGKAKVKLLGLPAKVSAPEIEIDKTTTEISFPVTIAPDSPKGQHKNLFCHLTIPAADTSIPHNVGHGGVLRIDPPPKKPAPKAAPKPEKEEKPATVAKAEPPKKPLSRLEKLRLEAKNK
ncbi:MAG: PPC domain-containing protein [Verrucomicrobiales bacterium]